MAKKKENKRRTYDLGSRDVITYEKSSIQRKMLFLILRGPGLLQSEIEAQNAEIQKVAARLRFKVKLVTVKTEEEVIARLKDANVWAGGIIYNSGALEDPSGNIKRTIQKLLIPTKKITEIDPEFYVDAVKELVSKQRS